MAGPSNSYAEKRNVIDETMLGDLNRWTQLFRGKKQQETHYAASHWRLMMRKLMKHKLAKVSLVVIGFMYVVALFGNFISPQGLDKYDSVYLNSRPTSIHFIDTDGKFHFTPFVYGMKSERDPETLRKMFVEDTSLKYPIKFFVKGEEYKLFGFIPSSIHLFGVEDPGRLFLFGTDGMGRDLFSRIVLGSQVSLTIPLVGVGISFVLGLFFLAVFPVILAE